MKKVLIMLSCILFKKAINSSPRFLYLPSVFIPIFINFVFILLVDCAYVQAAVCVLDAKFEPATLSDGMEYYTDRAYTLTSVPSQYVGLDMIKTPNDDRALTDASGGYITFELLNNATVFVAFDNRATSLPDWMSGFADTGDAIYTSLSTQQFLKVYSKNFISGDCINLGANQAAGFSGGIVSNYVVFYRAAAACVLDVKFQETILSDGMEYYTDRVYTFTNVPVQYIGLDMIKTPNDDRNLTAASDYLAFELQNDVTVYVAYDRRATSLPDWLNGFADTGDIINTSLGTQQFLKVYSKNFISGGCVNLGTNRAPGFSGGTVSNYVVFYGPPTTTPGSILKVSITAANMSENGGSSQATVRRYTDTTNALVVNLSSNDLGKAIVPETVTIAAGEATSPSFVVKAVDDAMVGGTQKVIITASAEGHTDGSDTINVMEEMLIWDPPLQLQNLAGYKVYYGKESGSYDISIDVFNETSFPLDYLPIGESYYLAVTAYDITRNESAYSNEVEYTSDIFFH